MRYMDYKLQGYHYGMDAQLPKIVLELRKVLSESQDSISNPHLHLDNGELEDVAGVLVDFAADIHASTGLWNCYEQYNIELFGIPLPLTLEQAFAEPLNGICLERVRHLLWIVYQILLDSPVLAPHDPNIMHFAKVSQVFLENAFGSLSTDSGIKRFLKTPNDYGWDVKRKLVWLGTRSYLFRVLFHQYMAEHEAPRSDIGYTDDFICQECTLWSGLGVIDILAGILDIDENDRKDLRNWYERHVAPYMILSANPRTLNAKNIINNQQYRIRVNMKNHPFVPGLLVMGGLTPWRGEWYWSGEQRGSEQDPPTNMIEDLKNTIRRQSPALVCRCDKEYEAKVRGRMAELHASSLVFHGRDLMVYPDGLSMAADWQKELRQIWESKSPEVVRETVKKHGLKNGRPNISIPDDLLEAKNGLGVFLNPDSGQEIMQEFNDLESGFRRKGIGLIDDENEAIIGFISSDVISPAFVRRMVEEYGDESIKSSFCLNEITEGYWLEYLLRCHKGSFFRKYYPAISLV